MDSVQHRASKIIIGAVSSTNNNKVEQEWGLPSLGNRRNLATSKFINRLLSNNMDHISTRVFNEWKGSTRLKRSSTVQLDKDIRSRINLEHSSLNFVQEPLFPRKPPSETKFGLKLLFETIQKRRPNILKQKGLDTIDKFSQDNLAIAYTDGSSDKFLNKGGFFILLPNRSKYHHKMNTGLIASNFTSELIANKETVVLYLNDSDISGLTDGLVIFF
ncbi:RNase H domain-containing protein [Caerostris extrusa]|uniref:RNase H domain-containing protein n=1 Tax=Caerostris extrusa TaxID=172846 RepID=A0AAV4SDR5_CAEEX|nr:RNase H domain-containing protein [Caerostris extrusa]